MNDELEALQKELILAQLENAPRRDSDRFIIGDTDTVSAGTSLTVTFTVNTDLFMVHLHKFYCDAIGGWNYMWISHGQPFDLNEGEYPWGKTVHANIILIINNPTASDGEVSYFIEGWGDKIG